MLALPRPEACVPTGADDLGDCLCRLVGRGEALGMVNAPHSRMGSFLAPLDGASARRPPLHLSWLCREEQARRPDATRLGMLAPQVANGATGLRLRAMWDEPQPFFDGCWGGRVREDEVDLGDLCGPELVSTMV